MYRSRTLAIVLAAFTTLLAGCAGMQPTQFNVNLDSISRADSSSKRSYLLMPGNKDTNANDLQFQEYASYVHRALAARGFVQAEDFDSANILLFLSYGIGNPQNHQYTYSLPVWGQTGYSGSTSYGTLNTYGGYGTYSGTTTYTPTYGVTGYTSNVGSYTTYFRFIVLDAYDVGTYKREQKLDQVWRSTVTSTGSSGDLRRVFPVMVAGVYNHLASNTGQRVGVTLDETNPAVALIKGVPTK